MRMREEGIDLNGWYMGETYIRNVNAKQKWKDKNTVNFNGWEREVNKKPVKGERVEEKLKIAYSVRF